MRCGASQGIEVPYSDGARRPSDTGPACALAKIVVKVGRNEEAREREQIGRARTAKRGKPAVECGRVAGRAQSCQARHGFVNSRTDSFASLGKMYGTRPGFYLLVGPGWQGGVPKGISKIFRASTNTGVVIPRVFQDDTIEDKLTIQPLLRGITMYPLAEYDGRMKSTDWSQILKAPSTSTGEAETVWVPPASFFDSLPSALANTPPLPGEEGRMNRSTRCWTPQKTIRSSRKR